MQTFMCISRYLNNIQLLKAYYMNYMESEGKFQHGIRYNGFSKLNTK